MAAKRNYRIRPAATPGRICCLIFAMIAALLNGCGSHTSSSPTQPNPVPEITGVSPNTIFLGSEAFALTVNGSNFNQQSTVRWNGDARSTTYVSSPQLQAAITVKDVSVSTTDSITVLNPAPGGGLSGAQAFTVPAIAVSISPVSVTLAAQEQQQFVAPVSNSIVTTVTWQVNGVSGGSASLGTISTSGLYTANSSATPVAITATLSS
jgi:hypothetical protein